MHVPKHERSKLNSKAKQCIFLRYSHDEFGYRLRDSEKKKVIRSRDVVFLKHQMVEDMKDGDDPQSSPNSLVDLDPVPSPMA